MKPENKKLKISKKSMKMERESMKIAKASVKDGILSQPVTTDLDKEVSRMRDKQLREARQLPLLLFGATFGRGGIGDVKTFTGLLLLTSKMNKQQYIRELQTKVAAVPYTLLAFRSMDKRQLHLVVRVTNSNGSEPASCEEYLQMMNEARRMVASFYASTTGFEVQEQELTIQSGCKMSCDEQLLYRADAQHFPVVWNAADPLDNYQRSMSAGNDFSDAASDQVSREQVRLEFYACLQHALEEFPDDHEQEQALVRLADYCRKALLEEETCVKRVLSLSRFTIGEDMVRKIFRAAYIKRYEGKAVSQMNQKERIARTIRDFFDRRYELRYNEVKQVTEFRPNDGKALLWQPLTDRDLKRMAFEEMLEGGHGWMIDMELYVNSSLVRRYNPILDYLAGVGEWNHRKDYIEEYARRLKTDYKRWPHFFHRWFLAMVAQALNKNRDHGNSMVPLLIGSQAMKKSTFCKNILPYALREYYMDDIKMDNAEQVERVLGRMWLVNIDEYNSKTDREQAKIKRLLTEKDVQVRKMRSDQYTMTPRLCSFIATTNDRQPLTDPTGSRRYLCVEMTGQADMSGTINYQQMFAQAVWEIKNGEQYWFDNDDEREIVEHNKPYQMCDSIDDLLLTFFEPASRDGSHFMTATAIHQHLSQKLHHVSLPSLNKLGRTLRRQHFLDGAQDGVHGYYVKIK